ncbi:hypothetical protein [Paraburkholderia sp. JHI869]|uniref:hypothetical protein n=1 Tax=Paraburkholderia sp. JHI869 TaxID=3112959 RepID=UPI003172B1D7
MNLEVGWTTFLIGLAAPMSINLRSSAPVLNTGCGQTVVSRRNKWEQTGTTAGAPSIGAKVI